MQLPPLPVIDGTSYYGEPCQALIFDNSSLEKWQTCKRLWQYSDLEKFSSTGEAAGRNFGSACHRAWETRYKLIGPGRVTPECAAAMNASLAKHFEEHPAPVGDFRNLDHAQKYIAVYNQVYPQEPWTILTTNKGEPFVERTFVFPMGEVSGYKLLYAGKSDLAVNFNSDEWTFDHKTAFQFGKSFEMEKSQDGGQLGYVWAFTQHFGRKPRGYIVNACRVRRPSKSDKYSDTAPVDATDFNRIPYDVSQDDLDDWKQDTLAFVEEIIWCHSRGYFPRHRKACVGKYGPCDFYNVCSVNPKSQRTILESNLYEPNTWTPLNKPS